jgi:C4-dicarboxylate transporter DctM subunit
MVLIIYGVVANQSIAALFLSTVIPGILLGFLFMLVNFWLSTRYTAPRRSAEIEHPSEFGFAPYIKGIWKSFYRAIPALTTPLIILGGIYGGAFTPTEAGAVACAWAIITGALVYRSLPAREIAASLLEGAALTASIFIIVTFVAVFSRVLIVNYVPQTLLDFILSLSTNKYLTLLLVNVVVLTVGMFIEGITIVLVLCPLLLPIAKAFQVDLIHFGAILCLNIGIGTITPPMAINIFVASSVGEVSIQEITKPILVFLLFGSLPVLILTTYIPSLALWLPNLIMK